MKSNRIRTQRGFTLIEVLVAMAVMTIGILSLVSVFTQGLASSSRSQIQYIAQQKAQEAMETIFSARDTKLLNSTQIANISGGGVFKDGPQPLCAPGPDGLFGTADDDQTTPDVIVTSAGPDKMFGTADDVSINLNPFMTRTILIGNAANTPNLKTVTVTVQWTFQGQSSQFQLVSLLSNFN